MKQIRPFKRLIANEKDTLVTNIKTKATYIISNLTTIQTAINDLNGYIDTLVQRSNKSKR
jgi:hypothetical protein